MKKFIKMLAVLTLLAALPFVCLTANAAEEAPAVRVAALKGPTGMALAHMMTENGEGYAFTLAAAPTEVNALVISGQVDIAAVPINVGAVLYNKTQGGVKALSLITRGMLYVLEKGESIHSVSDLVGKTIVTAGQGATPEYVTRYILDASHVDAQLEFLAEHAEVVSNAVAGKADIVLLPEPQVTNLLMKAPEYRVALDITEEFAAAARINGVENAQLSMSVVIARAEFAEKHPELVAAFMDDLKASIAFANEHAPEAAREIAALEIIPSAAVAERALPSCTLVFVSGQEMQDQASPLYQVLFDANPASVGGAVPDENYYLK